MDEQDRQAFRERVSKDLSDSRFWTKFFSGLHHTFLFGGAVLSASAAVVLQLDDPQLPISATNLATVLASAAAVTTAIAGSGGFERKWRTNRLIKVRLQQLDVDLTNPEVKGANIRQDLKDIAQLRYEGIVGLELPQKPA